MTQVAARTSGRQKTRYLFKPDTRVLLPWTPTLAARSDTIECDKHGTALENPENDEKRIVFLESELHKAQERIFNLEQELDQVRAQLEFERSKAVERTPKGPLVEAAEAEAGIAPPPMPSDAELYGQADALAQAAQAEVPSLQLAAESEDELEAVLPLEIETPPVFDLDAELARIQGSSADAGDVKSALSAFAKERYQVVLDHRYTIDKLKAQIRDLEAKR